jgi:dTDP-4-dehydrorhamnose 3,5-epimerase
MKIQETALPGVLLIEPVVHGDARGFFVEIFRKNVLAAHGVHASFVQDNHSRSARGVLRGLHYQLARPQGKLVRVARGRVLDVVVDIRRDSPHFGRTLVVELEDVAHRQLYIPPGFAHGFLVLSDVADFIYQCTDYYDPTGEGGVRWDDPALGIPWPDLGESIRVSDKDARLPTLAEIPPERLPIYPGAAS